MSKIIILIATFLLFIPNGTRAKSCTSNADCPSSEPACLGVTVEPNTGLEMPGQCAFADPKATTPSLCPTGQYYDPITKCSPKRTVGSDCIFPAMCESGKCENKKCVAIELPTTEEKYVPPLEPKLQIPIPGLKLTTIFETKQEGEQRVLYLPTIAEYAAGVYKYLISIVGIIAGIMIVWAGTKWLMSAGNADMVSDAKKKIGNAIIGLILAVGSYIILYLINPDLVSFKSLRIQLIERQLYAPGEEATEIAQTKGQQCFFQEFGSTESVVQSQIVLVSISTKTSGPINFHIHKKMEAALKAVGDKIKNSDYKMQSGGSFNWRPNVNHPETLSLHSFGIALDLNVKANPNYKKKSPDEVCKTDIPEEIIGAFESEGFKWGGKFKKFCDAMHFEWRGPCAK